eukprot:260133-Heterocapsa_arctica.AAC.1
MPVKAGRGRKPDDRFLHGTFPRSMRENGETIIGTGMGAQRDRTMRILHEDTRWSKEAMSLLKGT